MALSLVCFFLATSINRSFNISISEISDLVSQVKEKNVGVLVTDHNVKYLFDITDRSYVLGEQTVIAEGTSRDLLKSSKAIEHYFGNQFS